MITRRWLQSCDSFCRGTSLPHGCLLPGPPEASVGLAAAVLLLQETARCNQINPRLFPALPGSLVFVFRALNSESPSLTGTQVFYVWEGFGWATRQSTSLVFWNPSLSREPWVTPATITFQCGQRWGCPWLGTGTLELDLQFYWFNFLFNSLTPNFFSIVILTLWNTCWFPPLCPRPHYYTAWSSFPQPRTLESPGELLKLLNSGSHPEILIQSSLSAAWAPGF